MSRYADVEAIAVPDQWADIIDRAEAGALLDLEPDTPRLRARRVLPSIAVAASVLVAAVVVGVVLDDDRTDVATTDPVTQSSEGLPDLVCPDGELLEGSIPEDAVLGAEPVYTASLMHGTVSWGWEVGDQRVQVNVPGIPWTDQGNPTEAIAEPRGTIEHHPSSTVFVGRSGLSAQLGCGSFDVMVEGGTREEATAVALEVARSIRWQSVEVATDGVRDVASARVSAVAAVSSWAEYPGVVEVATMAVEVDDSLYAAVGLERGNPPLTRAYVAVVRATGGSRLTARGSNPVNTAELMLFVDGVGEHAYSLRSGFSDASAVGAAIGGPYEELRGWVPAIPLPPSWLVARES